LCLRGWLLRGWLLRFRFLGIGLCALTLRHRLLVQIPKDFGSLPHISPNLDPFMNLGLGGLFLWTVRKEGLGKHAEAHQHHNHDHYTADRQEPADRHPGVRFLFLRTVRCTNHRRELGSTLRRWRGRR
jgi:hypothetical protein